MVFDLPWPVLSATPNALSIAVSFMCGLLLLSSRKLTQPIVRMIPQAQVSSLPPSKGDGACGPAFQPNGDRGRILFVELLPAELVRHCDNQFKNRADFHRTLARCFTFCHFLPSLVLVRAPMGQPEPELLVLIDALLPHDITPKHSIRFSLVEPVGSNNARLRDCG